MNQYTIGELCEVIKGITPIMKAVGKEYPLVVTAEERKTHNAWQFDCNAVCVPIVSSTGHGHASIKRIHYQQGKFALGNILVAIIPKDENILNAEYLYIYLSLMKDEILVPLMKGTANVSLTVNALKTAAITVPGFLKQIEIVDRINKLSSYDLKLDEYFAIQLNNTTLLRQSILHQAVQGKLVPQDQNDVPASVLIDKIKTEKEQLIKEKKIKKVNTLPEVKGDEAPYELPPGWKWVRLGDFTSIKGGKRLPEGYTLSDTTTSHIYIRVTDMKNGTIDDSNLKYLTDEVFEQIEDYIIESRDLYITIVGSTIGKVGIVPDEFNNMNLTENAARIIIHGVEKMFLLHILKSSFMQDQFVDKTNQVGQPKLALIRLKSALFPLPPHKEQMRISRKIDQLATLCNELEKTVERSKQESKMLMQAVLHEAFELA